MPKFMTLIKIAAATTIIGSVSWAGYELTRPEYDGVVGIDYGSAHAPARGEDVKFAIWYPSQTGGRAVTVGGNGVFHGTPAGSKAPPQIGQFPLAILSHGAGGNAGQFGWIASELAGAGYVVVIPNHPGTTSGNASAEAAIRVWERPADITAVIDEITANPEVYTYIDTSDISMIGFSAGGYTAMALSGAQVDPDKLQSYCDESDHGMSDCAFLARYGVDLHAYDLSPAAQSLNDPRIKRTIAIDPGIIETIRPESLENIDIPMMVLNLGEKDTVPIGVYALPAAELIPTAEHGFVPDATHFSFLAECTDRGADILAKDGEPDPLCDDAGGRSRADIHADIAQRIIKFLTQS